jgi:hypothetical protein
MYPITVGVGLVRDSITFEAHGWRRSARRAVEHLVLVGHVLVERHGHDAELLRNLAHADRVDAALVRQGDGGPQDPLLGQGLPGRRGLLDLRGHPRLLVRTRADPGLDKCTTYTLGWSIRCTTYTKPTRRTR